MKKYLAALLCLSSAVYGQAWKTLPKGVRIVGYRNVVTSKVKSNFNQSGQETPLGAQFRVDGKTLNGLAENAYTPGSNTEEDAFNKLLLGEYKIDAEAQFNVHGTGFGWGLTDRVMVYAEVAFYNANVRTNLQRTKKNTYKEIKAILEKDPNFTNSTLADNIDKMPDVDEKSIQSVITNHYKYQPLGDWNGAGYGDMETGFMVKAIDRGIWGLMVYPGVVLPTGRQDDPDILQDVGFGDGQFDLFAEMATGYVVNDHLNFGTTLRYTYQAPTEKNLRIPEGRDFTLGKEKGSFDVKYGDRINWMLSSTLTFSDWLAFTPMYRYMYQLPSKYDSEFSQANEDLAFNSNRQEHQIQLTTSVSSITPFLKKQFVLPAQINVNVVRTISGKNVPNVSRFELELRMLF